MSLGRRMQGRKLHSGKPYENPGMREGYATGPGRGRGEQDESMPAAGGVVAVAQRCGSLLLHRQLSVQLVGGRNKNVTSQYEPEEMYGSKCSTVTYLDKGIGPGENHDSACAEHDAAAAVPN